MDVEVLLVGHSYLDRLLKTIDRAESELEDILEVRRPIHCAIQSGKSILDLKRDLQTLSIIPDILLIELGIVDLYWSTLDPEQLAVILVSEATRKDRICIPRTIVICLPSPATRITGTVASIEDIHSRIDSFNRMLFALTSDLPHVMLYEHEWNNQWSSDKLHPKDNIFYGKSIQKAISLAYSRIASINRSLKP